MIVAIVVVMAMVEMVVAMYPLAVAAAVVGTVELAQIDLVDPVRMD